MLKRVKALYDYTVRGTDGDFGTVHDVYFDGCTLDVCYIVVDTGPWLLGRKILLSPNVVEGISLGPDKVIRTHLTQQQVDQSPEIDLAKPVSRQQLEDLHTYHGWPWQGARFSAPVAYIPPDTMPPVDLPPTLYPPTEERLPSSAKDELQVSMQGNSLPNPCLHSCREVEGYDIQATDGEIGHVTDFFVEQDPWAIRYLGSTQISGVATGFCST
ncbi:MAG: PRC-barrel domain-containing protein [Anaerolineae bacterium]